MIVPCLSSVTTNGVSQSASMIRASNIIHGPMKPTALFRRIERVRLTEMDLLNSRRDTATG